MEMRFGETEVFFTLTISIRTLSSLRLLSKHPLWHRERVDKEWVRVRRETEGWERVLKGGAEGEGKVEGKGEMLKGGYGEGEIGRWWV